MTRSVFELVGLVHTRQVSPSKYRNRPSTVRIVLSETVPRSSTRRCFDIDRTASHMMKPGTVAPDSGGSIRTCTGRPRSVVVIGTAIIKSAMPRLNLSTDTTRTGRRPLCSRPRVGSRSACQTSPRRGLVPLGRRFGTRFVLETISERPFQGSQLLRVPCHRVRFI